MMVPMLLTVIVGLLIYEIIEDNILQQTKMIKKANVLTIMVNLTKHN